MARNVITLHEIRRSAPMGSASLGRRKLRTKTKAAKLCRFLAARYGITAVTHAWKILPTQTERATLRRMGA